MHHSRTAFTLVELSIVLVILGLLVGGVLAGQSLIRASELRAITTERDKYTTATYAFRDKYFALPGDMAEAYRFWGATCGTDTNDASVGCNGDGDGQIVMSKGEYTKAWEHLSRAGLIEGAFDGTGTVAAAGVYDYVLLSKTNVPASKFPQSFWQLSHSSTFSVAGDNPIALALHLGGIVGMAHLTHTPSLSHGEAYQIDKKVDDSHADTGKIRGNGDGTCKDDGTDYYSIAAAGEDFKGDCSLTFFFQ